MKYLANYSRPLRAATAVCGTLAALALPAGAYAQTSGGPNGAPQSSGANAPAASGDAATPKDAAADTSGDIIITATHAKTSLQKTPIAITVFDGQSLQANGVRNLFDISSVSPEVNITRGNFGSNNILAIRGVSSRDTGDVGDPAVAVSVDGFYEDRPYSLELAQFDLERIEVLKGPQGTLAGRNATAGAINIITARPTMKFGGFATVEFGNYGTINTEGAINVPLSDTFALRASFQSQKRNGFQSTNIGELGGVSGQAFRVQALWQPTSSLTLHLLVQRSLQDKIQGQYTTQPYRLDANGFVDNSFVYDVNPNYNTIPSNAGPYWTEKLNQTAIRGDVTFVTNPVTFTYLGGYARDEFRNPAHFYYANQPDIGQANPYSNVNLEGYRVRQTPKTLNQEFRVASTDLSKPLTFQAGVFYFRNDFAINTFDYNFVTGSTNFLFDYSIRVQSLAEYGQLTYKLSDTLKITGGMRHNQDKKVRTGTLTRPSGVTPATGTYDASADTFHAGIDWTPSSNLLIYGKFDTGFKDGGFTDEGQYGPERIKAGEIGWKFRSPDKSIQFNGALYYAKYSDQQIAYTKTANCIASCSAVANAGSSEYYGIETDLTATTSLGRFNVSVNYSHAEYIDFPFQLRLIKGNTATNPPSFVTQPITNVNFAGNTPPNAPRWSIGGSYTKDFFLAGSKFTFSANTRYTSAQYSSFNNYPDQRTPPYENTNALLSFQPKGSTIEISGYVRNVFNSRQPIMRLADDRGKQYQVFYQGPRQFGVRVKADF